MAKIQKGIGRSRILGVRQEMLQCWTLVEWLVAILKIMRVLVDTLHLEVNGVTKAVSFLRKD
jgi:hypothetical protein